MYERKHFSMKSLLDEPGEGRKTLGEEAARQYYRIRQLCPEDIATLEDRLHSWLKSNV